MIVSRRRFSALCSATMLASCQAPAQNFYRLAPLPGPPHPGFGGALAVRGIAVPGPLDQTEIAAPSTGAQFKTFPNDFWVGPIAPMLQDVMVQNLSQRLPQASVIASGGAIATPPGALLEINVLEFAPAAGGQVTLQMQAAVKSGPRASPQIRNFSAAAAAGADSASIVAAMSTLWAQAADQLAGWLSP